MKTGNIIAIAAAVVASAVGGFIYVWRNNETKSDKTIGEKVADMERNQRYSEAFGGSSTKRHKLCKNKSKKHKGKNKVNN